VLISILLPVLGRVRKQGEAVKCSAHLHGMGQAFQMYANSYRICVPGRLEKLSNPTSAYGLGDGGDQYRPRWYELLGAEVKQYASASPKNVEDDTWTISNEWFLCPSVPEWINSRNYPFGYNHQFLGNAREKKVSTGATGKQWINYPVPVARITNSSETVMVADSMGTAVSIPKMERQGYRVNGKKDEDAVGNKGYLLDAPRQTSASDRADIELDPMYHSGPDPRHLKKCNVLFVDGHVSLMTPEEMGYVVNPDGSMPLSGSVGPNTAHNRMFSGTGRDLDPPAMQ